MKLFTKEKVLEETKKLQYLYGLKYEIRYDDERSETTITESVAEHIYGMHILASYFLPLEDPEENWDREKIFNLITWHDIDEIETGDIIGYLKTDEDRKREAEAKKVVIEKSPEVLQSFMSDLLTEYEQRESIEAKYVKAIDKIEPYIHLYTEKGKAVMRSNKTTEEESARIHKPYVVGFPHIQQFTHIIGDAMKEEGFFTEET